MAAMTWTKEQQEVIEARNCSLLVSAAAGSGKTAVLVERILRRITDEKAPVDLDRLLVMTFTNAAAAEMRERIGEALEKRLEEDPGDRNLERQSMLLPHAKITTIDSFCLGLLREHFHELDIDPGFRVADEGELLLLQGDVLKALLEDCYQESDPEFLRFADCYASGKTDSGLEDYILQVWRFAQSNPWPNEWLTACKEELEAGTGGKEEDFEQTEWMRFLIHDVHLQAEGFKEQLLRAIQIAQEEDGPQGYLPMLSEDLRVMEGLMKAQTYGELGRIFAEPMFGRLAAARKKEIDPEKKELAAALRNQVKDGIKKIKALYFFSDPKDIFSDMAKAYGPVVVLIRLAQEFSDRFQAAKEEKNLVDFNDLEHFALQILTGGSPDHAPGPAADELARFYEEILVDEYQDSNQVQETLIGCISRERFGTPNVFMVGDVKQSIYKFRLAKPELFVEKYESYQEQDGPHRKIELHKNFRSRPQVLESINRIFYRIMTKPLGNIRYTKEAALYPGASFPAPEKDEWAQTELFLLNTGDPLFTGMDEERADYTAKEAEARLIGKRILELTDPETGMKIWNAKTGAYDPLKKKDIVILLRSLSGWAEEFLSVLTSMGIEAAADSRTGYFTAVEVETVLNLLALIDNPCQDIPLAGVLRSPIGGLSDRELAAVAAAYKKNPKKGQEIGFYGAVMDYLRQNQDAIYEKLSRFMELLSELRREAEYLPVYRLLYRIFEKTGYYDLVSVMPAGRIRRANLDMLVEKAAAFEKGSYQGVFDFIRYIEKLKKYRTDFGEATGAGEENDAVRIMSIHKSKGLEFPVVFLAGAGKAFNRQDARGKLLIDEALGAASDYIDPELRIKAATLKKNVLSRRAVLESMGEELRILYVAMTRAKEKLIITAADKYLENRLQKWKQLSGSEEESMGTGQGLSFSLLNAAGSYLDWLLMAHNPEDGSLRMEEVPVKELLCEEEKRQLHQSSVSAWLSDLREEKGVSVPEWISMPYAHEADLTLHAKMSVSELKERGQFTDDGESDFLPTIPDFMRTPEPESLLQDGPAEPESRFQDGMPEPEKRTGGESQQTAASALGAVFRGTAYHRALELLTFHKIWERADLKRELERIREEELMDPAAMEVLDERRLWRFFQSETARRMREAGRLGKLHKESQFVMGIAASEMDEADSEEPVLIQGIIDAWFEEEDGAVLVDYKTDRIKKGEETVLLERYRLQMIYYARALSQITGLHVKEAILYSLSLQEEIPVPV